VLRWLTESESRAASQDAKLREAMADEMADALNILCLLSVHTGIDLAAAVEAKLVKNALKYPAP
jgi:NTP pyrophosphatase (non-canonical NTP hydrolase)